MSTHKNIGLICGIAVAFALVVTVLLVVAARVAPADRGVEMAYEDRLFDTSYVHTLDIQIDDWDAFIATAESEEYSPCTVVIDGEAFDLVGIRGKGNTSLSAVSSLGSERYSFKLEFDQYESSSSYYGLDKLSLNNLIQDSTRMKDYLVYQAMRAFGVDAPLCSYVYITVNGEDWGLYLAVEGVEEAFLERNHGSDYGELYKPDSMEIGGGRGNGADFDMTEVGEGEFGGEFGGGAPAEGMVPPDGGGMPGGEMPDSGEMPGDTTPPDGAGGGMGSSDVKLQYIDDNASSYSNIFDNAKTNATDADKERLIESLRKLSSQEDLESVVDVDEVTRYFVVHNYVCNGDSYTGSMIHNYYLYEEAGRLSMIPWDYNLAFGGFGGGDASSTVNEPIDTPISGGDSSDRPMFNWIVSNEQYLSLYHEYFALFLQEVDMAQMASETAQLIASYVEKDPTAFYTYEEFEQGVAALVTFCQLRSESVFGQLAGTIPATTEGQAADPSSLIATGDLALSAMGSINDTNLGGGGDRAGEGGGAGDAAEADGEGAAVEGGGRPGGGFGGMGDVGGEPPERPERP